MTFWLPYILSFLNAPSKWRLWYRREINPSSNESTVLWPCLYYITLCILPCNLISGVICQFSSIYFRFLEDKKHILIKRPSSFKKKNKTYFICSCIFPIPNSEIQLMLFNLLKKKKVLIERYEFLINLINERQVVSCSPK